MTQFIPSLSVAAPTAGTVRYVAVVPAWAGRPAVSRAVYLRRRLMAGLVLFVVVVAAWLALAGAPAGNATGARPLTPAAGAPARTVVAQPGDTLDYVVTSGVERALRQR